MQSRHHLGLTGNGHCGSNGGLTSNGRSRGGGGIDTASRDLESPERSLGSPTVVGGDYGQLGSAGGGSRISKLLNPGGDGHKSRGHGSRGSSSSKRGFPIKGRFHAGLIPSANGAPGESRERGISLEFGKFVALISVSGKQSI